LTNDMLVLYEMHPTLMQFEYMNVADIVVEALNATRSRLPLSQRPFLWTSTPTCRKYTWTPVP
jgi:hypothetical protein